MKNAILLLLVAALASCQNNQAPKEEADKAEVAPQLTDWVDLPNDSFDVALAIIPQANGHYNLSVDLQLHAGTYVVSPFSEDTIYGHFNISFAKEGKILPIKILLESPESIAEYDPIIKDQVNFVRQSTTYTQPFALATQEDFRTQGEIWFILEPICLPYKVIFEIVQKDGALAVEKKESIIDLPKRNSKI